MHNNPFQITVGIEPPSFISRLAMTDEILDSFTSDTPSSQVYMLTGVRGSGKTVLLSHIATQLRNSENWIVVELNPLQDLLISLAAKLYDTPGIQKAFIDAKIDLSAFGFGISIEKAVPASDIGSALEKMFNIIKKNEKRVLITIDEAVNNEHVRIFAGQFQLLMRQGFPIFLLMTGLYDKIYDLQNEDTLTFLYRAPKIDLTPLNLNSIARKYESIFNIPITEAMEMAKLTMGYPFAYQVLGYLRFKKGKIKNLDELLPEYDQYLEEYVYEKLWSELSDRDREVMSTLATEGKMKTKELREKLDISSGEMSTYRTRLARKGIVDVSKYGTISIALPRFAEIIQLWNMLE